MHFHLADKDSANFNFGKACDASYYNECQQPKTGTPKQIRKLAKT
jgi:hypothetical protein